MKNKSILAMTAAAVCILAAVPVRAAEVSGNSPEVVETLSYVIDFLDDDGNFLDSKICTYGDVLEDIQIPEQREDEQYIYEFAGWEPQLQKVVTESALYTAVYRRISKADGTVSDVMPREVSDGIPAASASENFYPEDYYPEKDVQQVTATSYDVVPFHIETQEEPTATGEPEEKSPEPSVFLNTIPATVFPEKKNTANDLGLANEQITVLTEEKPKAISEETPVKTQSVPVILTEVHNPAPTESLAPAEELANTDADTGLSVVNAGKAEPEISAAPQKAVKKSKSQGRKQSPPTEHTDAEDSARNESRQETGMPFSIPVFLAGTVVGGAVCMKGRRAS